MVEEVAMNVAYGVLAGALYGFIWFSRRKAEKTPTDEPIEFDPYKLGATLVIGAGVGISLSLAGNPIGEAAVAEQIAANAGLIAMIEGAMKAFRDSFFD